jgi:hypothetical protein
MNQDDLIKVRTSELPSMVTQTLGNSEYSGWTISNAYRTKNSDQYLVEVKKGAQTKNYWFDKNGNRMEGAGKGTSGSGTSGTSGNGVDKSSSGTSGSGMNESGTSGSGTNNSGTSGSGTSGSGTGTSGSGTSGSGSSGSGTSGSGTTDK